MGIFSKIKAAFSTQREDYDDPVLGKLWREDKGFWMGEVPFEHPPTRTNSLSLLIDAGEGKPTDAHRQLYREVVARYAQLWPAIAERLAQYHPDLKTVEKITEHIEEPTLYLREIREGQPREWSMDYTFALETEGDMSYSADFTEWELAEVSAGD